MPACLQVEQDSIFAASEDFHVRLRGKVVSALTHNHRVDFRVFHNRIPLSRFDQPVEDMGLCVHNFQQSSQLRLL